MPFKGLTMERKLKKKMVLAFQCYYFPPNKNIFYMLACEVTLIYYKSDVSNKWLMQCKSAYV